MIDNLIAINYLVCFEREIQFRYKWQLCGSITRSTTTVGITIIIVNIAATLRASFIASPKCIVCCGQTTPN